MSLIDLNILTHSKVSNNIIEASIIEESYFNSTLLYISETKKDIMEDTKTLYKNILESGNDTDLILESFSDFFGKVKEMIDKFIKYIVSLFNRFIIQLNKLVGSDKYILKHKSDFTNFEDKHEFDYEGYNFTFVDNIPTIEAQAAFNRDFVELNFEGILQDTDQLEILKKISAQQAKLSNDLNNDRYDCYRQDVIRADAPIQKDYYTTELFRVYRSGEDKKENISINQTRVYESLSRVEGYKKSQSSVKVTKERIEREYNSIKKSLENMIYRNKDLDAGKLLGIEIKGEYDGAGAGTLQVNAEIMAKIDLFIKTKVTEITELSSIHAMAFSYKLDAIKDCYKQDKQILYKALSEIQKGGNK